MELYTGMSKLIMYIMDWWTFPLVGMQYALLIELDSAWKLGGESEDRSSVRYHNVAVICLKLKKDDNGDGTCH